MEADIGGRRMLREGTTIPTPRHTAGIMEVTVTIMQRLTIIPPRERTGGNRLLMARMVRRPVAPVTILTLGPMLEARRCRRLTAVEVLRRPIIRPPGPLRKQDTAPVGLLSGQAPMFRGETRAVTWAITHPGPARALEQRVRRAAVHQA